MPRSLYSFNSLAYRKSLARALKAVCKIFHNQKHSWTWREKGLTQRAALSSKRLKQRTFHSFNRLVELITPGWLVLQLTFYNASFKHILPAHFLRQFSLPQVLVKGPLVRTEQSAQIRPQRPNRLLSFRCFFRIPSERANQDSSLRRSMMSMNNLGEIISFFCDNITYADFIPHVQTLIAYCSRVTLIIFPQHLVSSLRISSNLRIKSNLEVNWQSGILCTISACLSEPLLRKLRFANEYQTRKAQWTIFEWFSYSLESKTRK